MGEVPFAKKGLKHLVFPELSGRGGGTVAGNCKHATAETPKVFGVDANYARILERAAKTESSGLDYRKEGRLVESVIIHGSGGIALPLHSSSAPCSE